MPSFLRLLSLLALLGFASSAQAVIPTTERAVLIDLYNSTNGANWTNSTGWLGEPGTECSWFGISCDANQSHVTNIVFNNYSATNAYTGNNLVGTIPSLSGLTALVAFDVAHNQLTGSIPSLSGLTALQNFSVFNNQLTGTIPTLSGLTALGQFSVSNNQLTGTIPSLSGLTALVLFNAVNNQLTGSIPSLSGLTALKWFAVAGNQLTGSIPSLRELIALEEFSVANNQLTGAVPATSSSLVAGRSNLCTNNLSSSGDPTIDAAWVTATGQDWLACQSSALVVPVITASLTSTSLISGSATLISKTAITGSAPLTVGFSASASSSNANDVLTYTWSFGDGQTGTGDSSQHTYSSAGTYTASLIVDNGQGQSASPKETVTVTITSQATPTCIAPEVLQNGVCVTPTPVCIAPQVLENNVCVTPTPICNATQVLENNVCVTPTPVCSAPQVLENNVCVTPTSVCSATEIRLDNVCVAVPTCTAPQILKNNVCVVPTLAQIIKPTVLIASGSFAEPNDTALDATPILINDQPLFQIFTSAVDEDWYEFNAKIGENYTINIPTDSTGKLIDPALELYDAAGKLLESKVNNGAMGEGEQLQWTAPSASLFRIRVTHQASVARAAPDDESFKGEAVDYSYQIRVFLTDAPLKALTKGRVLDHCNLGLRGAEVNVWLGGSAIDSTLTNKAGDFGLLLDPGNYELKMLAADYQQLAKLVTVGQESRTLLDTQLIPLTDSACGNEPITETQQASVVYDDQTGQLIVKDVVLDGSQVYYVELQNIGDFRFQLTRMLTLPGVIHSNPPAYSSITSLADLPKVFALDQNWRVQMKHIGDGVLPLESAEPY